LSDRKRLAPSRFKRHMFEILQFRGASSVRAIQEVFPEKDRPASTTVQTMVDRLEGKNARVPREPLTSWSSVAQNSPTPD